MVWNLFLGFLGFGVEVIFFLGKTGLFVNL